MTLPNTTVNELQSLLDQEFHLYQEIEAKLVEKKTLIITGDALQLTELDKTLMTLHQRAVSLEKNRIDLMKQSGQGHETLQELILALPPENAQPLMVLRKKLQRTLATLQELNQQNKVLLDLSIQWIEQSVNLIASAIAPEGASYNATGGKAEHPANHRNTEYKSSTVEHSA